MPTIERTQVIHAPVSTAVEVARDVESYPSFMPDVASVRIIEKSEDGSVLKTQWVGVIKQFRLTVKWTQEERWDFAKNRVEFRQLEGDYDKMEGWWEFRPSLDGTEFVSFLDYEYRVPLLGSLVTKVIHHLAQQNVESVMKAIAAQAEARSKI